MGSIVSTLSRYAPSPQSQNMGMIPDRKRRRGGVAQVPNLRKLTPKKSRFIQDVDMLISNNERAFLYDSGKVDITKATGIKTVRFPNKKSAALYLMKAGWQYV